MKFGVRQFLVAAATATAMPVRLAAAPAPTTARRRGVSTKDTAPEQAKAAGGARRTFEVQMSIDAGLDQAKSASAAETEGK